MARFSAAQRNTYISDGDAVIDGLIPDAGENTANDVRGAMHAMNARQIEADRHLPDISCADGYLFQIGSDPNNWFEIELLEAGSGQGISDSGFQLVPMVTGNGTQANPSAGGVLPSNPFDGTSEIDVGLLGGPLENMLQIQYTGQYLFSGQILLDPDGGQSNRQVEGDIFVFNSAGTYKFPLGLLASENVSPNDKSSMMTFLTSTFENPLAFVAGDAIAMVLRKHTGEPATTVTVKKCSMSLTLTGLGQG